MKYRANFRFLILLLLASSCVSVKNDKASITQGVYGKVVWKEGNQMPSLNQLTSKTSVPIIRTVYIYRRTKFNETIGQFPLFSKVHTSKVARIKTNSEGYFQCKLRPGKYSIFIGEGDGMLFANLSDGEGNITPFEVSKGIVTRYDIEVNYKAAY